MTRENVGLKSAPAEQAYLPQHENVVHGRVLAGEIHQPQWRLRNWGATSTDVYTLRRHSTRNSHSSAPKREP
jgi:hypothetical protein